MVDLVALFQSPQDGDGVLHRWRRHEDLLKPALEGGVFFDVLAVLVERGGADHAQLASGQHRLDHVAGVHGPFGRTRSHDGVELVDEGDDLALGVGDLLQYGLQAFLELAPVLGPGHHRAHVEADDPLALEPFRNVTLDDALGQSLDDGRLADAGLTDQDRVVLGPTRQDLDDPADLFVASDDRVHLPLAGQGGQVPAVLLEGLEGLFGILRGDPVAAPHVAQCLQQRVALDSQAVRHGQQQVLDRQVLVAHVDPLAVSGLEGVSQVAVQCRLGTAEGLGQTGQFVGDAAAHHRRLDPHPGQDGAGDPVGLVQDSSQHVLGADLGVAGLSGAFHGGGQRLLGLERPAFGIEGHRAPPLPCGGLRVVRVGTGSCDSGTRSRRYWRWVMATASRALWRVASTSARRRITSAWSSSTRRTPSKLRPSLVSAWIWRRRSRSRSENRRLPPWVRVGSSSPVRS